MPGGGRRCHSAPGAGAKPAKRLAKWGTLATEAAVAWRDRRSPAAARLTGCYVRGVAFVDVVVVSFNSRANLRACVEPLAGLDGVDVFVVDNASPDRSLEVVADLPVQAIPLSSNSGFAHGCNVGMRAGTAPYVLLLNPDTTIEMGAVRKLVDVLESNPRAGAVAPRIVGPNGDIHYSLRRFPRLRSTYSQALFLHRFFPRALWADETIRRDEEYARPGVHEWVSGACVLLRRSLLEQLDGLDEGFFLYCEDTDLCLRIRTAGHEVRFEPAAVIVHEGGASASRSSLLHVAAASRIRYARKHRSRVPAFLERVGIGLGAVTHMFVGRGGRDSRAGHAHSLRQVASRAPENAWPDG